MGYEELKLREVELDFDDDLEFEELEDSDLEAQAEILATRVRAARYAGA
jgi:hypothetical protein